MDGHTKISAQVVLKPADENVVAGEHITSENVHRLLPSAESCEKAQKFFAEAKFEVENTFANSFSISAELQVFEKVFKTEIFRDARQNFKIKRGSRETGELPLDNLPAEIREIIETVTFSEMPDFGPGNF